MDHVIGIDGGGTKTSAVIADSDGKVLAQAIAGPTNPNVIAHETVFQTLSSLIAELNDKVSETAINVTCVFAGISGAGNDIAKKTLDDLITMLVNESVAVYVEPDSINALYSGTYGQPGIVQISGTGSITYGINNENQHDRVGGWGYLFGDEGSGYDFGRQGIVSVLKAVDGRGNSTILQEMLRNHYQVTNEFDLIQKIYSSSAPKDEIAQVSRMVMEAYRKNDEVATQILEDTATEMALSIRTLYQKLFSKGQEVKVVLCGGVFSDRGILPKLLERRLQNSGYLKITMPDMSPVGGSVIGALLMKDRQKLNPHVIQNIISSL